jgi:hypothetical protein
MAAVCATAIAVLYIAWYLRSGYGAHTSSYYLDTRDPSLWLRVAPARALREAGLALGLPPSWCVTPAVPALAVVALVVAVLALRAPGAARVLALFAAAIAPTVLGPVCDRSALVATVPAAWLVALVGARVPRWARAGAVVAACAWFVVSSAGLWQRARARRAAAIASAAASELDGQTPAIVVDTQDHPTPDLLFARAALGVATAPVVHSDIVPGRGAHRVARVGARAFSVEGDDLLAAGWAAMMRRRAPFEAGEEVRANGLSVRVDQVREGSVQRIVVTVDRPLDELTLLVWRDGALRRVTLPEDGSALAVGH